MNFLELVNERHSTRRYTDRKVDQEKLEQIIEAARVAEVVQQQYLTE